MRSCKNFPLRISAIYRSGGLTQGVQSHMVALMADQELASAVQRAPVSNPKRDRISTALRFRKGRPENSG